MLVKQIEQTLRVRDDSRGPPVPAIARDLPGKGFNLKIVFNVNAEDVRSGAAWLLCFLVDIGQFTSRRRASALRQTSPVPETCNPFAVGFCFEPVYLQALVREWARSCSTR